MLARIAAFRKTSLCIAFLCAIHEVRCEGALKDWIKTPPCTLPKDPVAVFPLLSLCINGKAGVWAEHRSRVEDEIQPPLLLGSRGSATLVLTSWLTFRSEGYANVYQNRTTGKTERRETRPETLLAQIGNNSTHRHRIFGGKARIPFGLNFNVDSSWASPTAFNKFFGEVIKVAGYTYDNQKDLTITISGGTADNVDADAKRRKSAVGVRMMYDMAALEGTRILMSLLTDELEHRRGEVGAVNVNGKGDITAFEVVRTWRNFLFDPNDFDQLIRLSWQGAAYQRLAPQAQYEDQLNYRRIGTLGAKFNAKKQVDLALTLGYSKDETGANRGYWFGIAGMEVHL